MAEGHATSAKRASTRLKEKVATSYNHEPTSNASKVSAFMKAEKEEFEKNKRQYKSRSRSVTSRLERNSTNHDDQQSQNNPINPRGRSQLKHQNLIGPNSVSASPTKAAKKRAKSLSRSQQRLDLLWLHKDRLSQGVSDEEISFKQIGNIPCTTNPAELSINKLPGSFDVLNRDRVNAIDAEKVCEKDIRYCGGTITQVLSAEATKDGSNRNTQVLSVPGTIGANPFEAPYHSNPSSANVISTQVKDPQPISTPKLQTASMDMDGMLKTLTDKIDKWGNDLKKEIQEVKIGNTQYVQEVTTMKNEHCVMKKDLQDVKKEVGQYKIQVKNLVAVVSKQQLVIKECKEQLENLQAATMRNNIIICGIKEQKDENCIQTCANFFRHKMKIDPILQ